MTLENEACEACRVGAPRVEPTQQAELLQQIPQWQVVNENGIEQLQRVFSFPNFVAALAFTNAVGALAEQHHHHPALLTEWGRVTVRWWTHKIEGLHRNDFVLAAKTDRLQG